MNNKTYTQAEVDVLLAGKPVGQPPPSALKDQDTDPVTVIVDHTGTSVTCKFKLDPRRGRVSKSGISIIRAMANGINIEHNGATYRVNVLCYEKI